MGNKKKQLVVKDHQHWIYIHNIKDAVKRFTSGKPILILDDKGFLGLDDIVAPRHVKNIF